MHRRFILATLMFSGALGLSSAPASAQAVRTWVSAVGDDANPCSRTAPCKTFAGAISKTSAGGEINCLDPGGYGAVTITKSMTIDCEDTQGSAFAGFTTGVLVNDGSSGFPNTIRVILRGISFNGASSAAQNAQGNPGTGLHGVRFISGAQLTITDCIIQNFNGNNANGVTFAPAGAARLVINNSTIINNGTGATGGGVLIQPTGANGSARAELNNVAILNNPNAAVRLDTTGNTSSVGIQMTIRNSQLNNNTNGLSVLTPANQAVAQANIFNSELFNNQPGSALVANGANALIRAGGNVLIGNGAAVSISNGASIRSFGDNRVDGNSNPSSFTLPNITPQ